MGSTDVKEHNDSDRVFFFFFVFCFFFFFFFSFWFSIMVLRPVQDYFTHIKSIGNQMCAKPEYPVKNT